MACRIPLPLPYRHRLVLQLPAAHALIKLKTCTTISLLRMFLGGVPPEDKVFTYLAVVRGYLFLRSPICTYFDPHADRRGLRRGSYLGSFVAARKRACAFLALWPRSHLGELLRLSKVQAEFPTVGTTKRFSP